MTVAPGAHHHPAAAAQLPLQAAEERPVLPVTAPQKPAAHITGRSNPPPHQNAGGQTVPPSGEEDPAAQNSPGGALQSEATAAPPAHQYPGMHVTPAVVVEPGPHA
jgi:hypothetical protein